MYFESCAINWHRCGKTFSHGNFYLFENFDHCLSYGLSRDFSHQGLVDNRVNDRGSVAIDILYDTLNYWRVHFKKCFTIDSSMVKFMWNSDSLLYRHLRSDLNMGLEVKTDIWKVKLSMVCRNPIWKQENIYQGLLGVNFL